MCVHHHKLHNDQDVNDIFRLWLPCLVSPEREDLLDTDDCTERTEDVSARVLSDINPPPSPSVWTVVVDWHERRNLLIKNKNTRTRTVQEETAIVSLTIVLILSWNSISLLVSVMRVIFNK